MNQNEQLFIYEVDEIIAGRSRYEPKISGKWILFYRTESLLRIWAKIRILYRTKKLEGVEFLQVSKDLSGSAPNSFKMVGFICGPSDNVTLMEWYGSKLMATLRSIGRFDVDCMLYMGSSNSVLSRLEVPAEWRAETCHLVMSQHPTSPVDWTAINSSIFAPMKTTDENFLTEEENEIEMKYTFHPSESGKWILFYEKSTLDYMWSKACLLYRAGELTGIKSLKVYTAKKTTREASDEKGVILFNCGPSSKEDLVKKYGKNILKLMRNFGPFDTHHMPYKTDVQSKLGSRSTGNKNNSIYTLQIPEAWRSEYCKQQAGKCNVTRTVRDTGDKRVSGVRTSQGRVDSSEEV